MKEGYIVYESFYYASKYIKQINDTLGVVIWDDERDEDKREGELLEMKGKRCLIRSKPLIFQSSHFHITNFNIYISSHLY